MTHRGGQSTKRVLLGVLNACGLLLAVAHSRAEVLRVISWNLGVTSEATPSNRFVVKAASALAELQPDVILLQGVPDWPTCTQITEALKPTDYNVLLCSAFQTTAAPAQSAFQVAVLSKYKGYFSWSKPWKEQPATTQCGFGFVALQAGKRRLGFFTAGLEPVKSAEDCQQLLEELQSTRSWEVNQPETFIIALNAWFKEPTRGKLNLNLGPLESAGFIESSRQFSWTNTEHTSAPGEPLLVETSVFPVKTQRIPVTNFPHALIACDLEIDPVQASVAWKVWAEANRATALARLAQAQPPGAAVNSPGGFRAALWWWLAATLGGVLTLLPFTWLLARRRTRDPVPALLTDQAPNAGLLTSGYTVVVSGSDSKGTNPTQSRPTVQIELPGTTQTQSTFWQNRALEAEEQLRQTRTKLRERLLPAFRSWLKQKFVKKLISDRAALLDTQQVAAEKTTKVEQRLARIENQIQHQNRAYEKRIEELTCELVSAKEENRELIRNRIAQVKAEMAAAQARLRQQAQDNPG